MSLFKQISLSVCHADFSICDWHCSVYDGDLENPKEVLVWVVDLITGADIEEVIVRVRKRQKKKQGEPLKIITSN